MNSPEVQLLLIRQKIDNQRPEVRAEIAGVERFLLDLLQQYPYTGRLALAAVGAQLAAEKAAGPPSPIVLPARV